MTKLKKVLAKLAVSLLVFVAILVAMSNFTEFIGMSIKYEIVGSYQGWATVIYEEPSCEPLEHNWFYIVIPINEIGKGCTSDPISKGWRYTKYVYVNSEGKQIKNLWKGNNNSENLIWAGFNQYPEGGYPHTAGIFFVGSNEQLEKSWSDQPK